MAGRRRRVIPAKGAKRPQSRDPLAGQSSHGPVLALARVNTASQTLDPAVLLNGSRLSLASLGRPG